VTGSAERAGATCRAATGHAANGGTALASRRSAAAAALPPPLKQGGSPAVSSTVLAHRASSRPALCCFIATVPWSGSWLLSEALAATGVDEVFSVEVHWYQLLWLYDALAPGAFFTRAYAAELLEAKLAPLQYVFLSRRDTARHAIAYYLASRAQNWFAREPSGGGFESDPVDLQQIRWFEDVVIEHGLNWRQYFVAGGIEPIDVQYEDLASDYEETVASVLSQLGIASRGRLGRHARHTVRPPDDDRGEAILAAYLPMREHLEPKGPDVCWDASAKRFAIRTGRPALP
jgi:LPS sulfotransferase NodH